jgi:hypothetical protein
LYSDAIAAFQSSQSGRESDARTALSTVLSPFDPSSMTVADVHVDPNLTRFVFTDGYIDLAVLLPASGATRVVLVTGSAGDWTQRGDVAALADLGKLLPGVLPPPVAPPPSAPAWSPGTAYKVGDQVTYDGTVYTCLIAHTAQPSWTPPVVPTMWQAA